MTLEEFKLAIIDGGFERVYYGSKDSRPSAPYVIIEQIRERVQHANNVPVLRIKYILVSLYTAKKDIETEKRLTEILKTSAKGYRMDGFYDEDSKMYVQEYEVILI